MSGTIKDTKSAPFFKATRVSSCQFVQAANGQAKAVAFPTKKTGYKAPNSWTNQSRSSEVQSHNGSTFKTFPNQHAGMAKKPLAPYNPDSFRSRLPSADFVAPYKNASQVEIGDRSSYNSKSVFRTTNQALHSKRDMTDYTSNQGIIAEKTKWHKTRSSD